MTVTQYKNVSWTSNEPLEVNKLNAMVYNSRYLYEHATKVYYNAYGHHKRTNLMIACGSAVIPANTSGYTTSVTIKFGGLFDRTNRPVIVTSTTSSYNRRVCDTIEGITTTLPDATGFQATLAVTEFQSASPYILNPLRINWIAMGYDNG